MKHNCPKEKGQNSTHKTKDGVIRAPLKIRGWTHVLRKGE